MGKPRVVVIGANEFQNRLILKARECGYETHVFAWAAGDVGESTADFFYPVSIVEKEQILERCRALAPVGVCSIGSDLAAITVNYVAGALGLVCNSQECTRRSTNKHAMRLAFERAHLPSPKSVLCGPDTDLAALRLAYPVIVKPTDRSGSRAITRLEGPDGLAAAVSAALAESFEKRALIEEFAPGSEYSVEYVSWRGEHHFLAVTKKYTTGAPHFIETGHLQPAGLPDALQARVRAVVERALDALGVENGASHSELKIDRAGQIRLIEIGARMGGDCIGSDLVQLSTGYDFVRMVLDIACGRAPVFARVCEPQAAAVRFVFAQEDAARLEQLRRTHPEALWRASEIEPFTREVRDSASRFGYYILRGPNAAQLTALCGLSDDIAPQ